MKKIGIWGLGVVGKSAINYFHKKGYAVQALDRREPTDQEKEFLAAHNVSFLLQEKLANFLEDNDYILASCGIDLRPYQEFNHKFLSELDIFGNECQKPIIAITGSVGKTTVTHLLSQLISHQGKRVFTGGNIGIGLLDSIQEANKADYVILEVSSFQLERCKTFKPTVAIFTNIYANHLDRHGSLQSYIDAKLNIIARQDTQNKLLFPLELREQVMLRPVFAKATPGMQADEPLVLSDSRSGQHERNRESVSSSEFSNECIQTPTSYQTLAGCKEITAALSSTTVRAEPVEAFFFNKTEPTQEQLNSLSFSDRLYFLHNSKLMMHYQTNTSEIFDFKELPTISYLENVIILSAALHILHLKLDNFVEIIDAQELPHHRLEKIATINGVDFYNDSKATIPASTLAAIEKIHGKPIILFLGGVSKGVDRSEFVAQLKGKVKLVYCFGKEAEQLKSFCDSHNIPAIASATLDQAFEFLPHNLQANDQILFSPAGASYDLFADYQKRGEYFIKLVHQLKSVA